MVADEEHRRHALGARLEHWGRTGRRRRRRGGGGGVVRRERGQAAEAGDAEGGSPASGDGQRGSMRSRSVSSNLADALTVPPAVPLTRSAASELAITLGDDMRLE